MSKRTQVTTSSNNADLTGKLKGSVYLFLDDTFESAKVRFGNFAKELIYYGFDVIKSKVTNALN